MTVWFCYLILKTTITILEANIYSAFAMYWALCQGLYIIVSIKPHNKVETEAQRSKVIVLGHVTWQLSCQTSRMSLAHCLVKIAWHSVFLLSSQYFHVFDIYENINDDP